MSDDKIFSDEQLVLLRSASMLRYFTVKEVAKHAYVKPEEAKEFFTAHSDWFGSNQNPDQANFKWALCVKPDKLDTITEVLQNNRVRLNIRVAELALEHGNKEDRLFLYCLDRVAASLLEARRITIEALDAKTDEKLLSRLTEAERELVSLRDSTPLRDELGQPVNRSNAEMRGFARIYEISAG